MNYKNSKHRAVSWFLAAGLALGGIAALSRSLYSMKGRETAKPVTAHFTPLLLPTSASSSESDTDVAAVGPVQTAMVLVAGVRMPAGLPGLEGGNEPMLQLAKDAQEALHAYFDLSAEPLAGYFQRNGIDPPPSWTDHKARDASWARYSPLLTTAKLSTKRAYIRQVVIAGTRVLDDEPIARRASRDGARGFLSRITPKDLFVAEFVVPARVRDAKIGEFGCRIGFEFTRDPSGKTWILTGTAVYDAPNESEVVPPLL